MGIPRRGCSEVYGAPPRRYRRTFRDFPALFPAVRELRLGDWFAVDCLVSQESSSNRCVFVVSSHAGKVLKLPCVSAPASASVLTGDAKPLGVGCERPPDLLRPFSGCRMWSVSPGF